jgi:hypothetical protein
MTYAVQPPPAAPASPPRRPVTVGFAATLLAVLGVGGLAYAVTTLAVTPTVVDHFRRAVAASSDVDGLVTLLWVVAAIGSVLAVILLAVYVVLALGLRRGSNGSRIAVWVLCALGILGGCASAVTVLVQRSGDPVPGSLGQALVDAYPGGWIGLNLALSIAQVIGYAVIAVLLVMSPAAFFGRGAAPATPTYAGIPGYIAPPGYNAPPGYGPPAGYGTPPGYGPSPGPGTPPGYGVPAGFGTPPGYGVPAGFGTPPGSGVPSGHGSASGYRPAAGSAPSGAHPGPVPAADPDADFWRRPAPPGSTPPTGRAEAGSIASHATVDGERNTGDGRAEDQTGPR